MHTFTYIHNKQEWCEMNLRSFSEHIACYCISDIFQDDSLLFLGNMLPLRKSNLQHHLVCADGPFLPFDWLFVPVWMWLKQLSFIWACGLIVINSVLNTACCYGSNVEMSDVSPQTPCKQILYNGRALFPRVYFTSSVVHLCAGFKTHIHTWGIKNSQLSPRFISLMFLLTCHLLLPIFLEQCH